ncbi:MAG TPA: YtxH domain-containing protein [Chloroflexota bacterium]|nr:YtxH domain-containing protein [Chloroflexota bacterium]
MKSEQSGAGFFVGFLLGGVVGAAAALLITPRSGDETRDTIMERGIELKVKAEEVAARAMDEADDLFTKGRTVLDSQRYRIQEAVEEGKEAAAQKKAELLSKYRVAKETGEAPQSEPSLADEIPPRTEHPTEPEQEA